MKTTVSRRRLMTQWICLVCLAHVFFILSYYYPFALNCCQKIYRISYHFRIGFWWSVLKRMASVRAICDYYVSLCLEVCVFFCFDILFIMRAIDYKHIYSSVCVCVYVWCGSSVDFGWEKLVCRNQRRRKFRSFVEQYDLNSHNGLLTLQLRKIDRWNQQHCVCCCCC